MPRDHLKRVLLGSAIALLAIQVVGLLALAKQSQALPGSNPEHFLSSAIKMIVSQVPAARPPAALGVVAQVVPPQSEFRTVYRVQHEKVKVPQIGLTVSLQQRPPPPVSL
jgi:hypothetical protein